MNQAPSKMVTSSQIAPHRDLGRRVRRHLDTAWRQPAAPASAAALEQLAALLADEQRPLILDSFCGTGLSTALLAAAFPDSLVIGVDKSAHRLEKHGPRQAENYALLRADCSAVWAWLAARGAVLARHYLLYPNPWPKPGHLGRRIHGHPAFTLLLQLRGELELRSNWQVYAEEFGIALHIAGQRAAISVLAEQHTIESLFERKYRNSGHTLWRCRARLM